MPAKITASSWWKSENPLSFICLAFCNEIWEFTQSPLKSVSLPYFGRTFPLNISWHNFRTDCSTVYFYTYVVWNGWLSFNRWKCFHKLAFTVCANWNISPERLKTGSYAYKLGLSIFSLCFLKFHHLFPGVSQAIIYCGKNKCVRSERQLDGLTAHLVCRRSSFCPQLPMVPPSTIRSDTLREHRARR